ncbi:cellobiose phosphotransferase system ydjC-like protein [Vibrio ishigakensis]|uniref:Cellobiose phosphotransferase system ydjC-like protein n=1 Tax=Vibrio ishigakensis TaxID=1481914 RepID=A0A0B8QHD5_9VIBR|nr:cellobiose phosphotransferase system ydjC-like protein [Vibrio ishigakensis]
MKLIINADDFGLTAKVNEAIVRCMRFGLVRSTTIMMNQPGVEDAIDRYHNGQVPEIGLHLTLTAGKPLTNSSEIPDLVNSEGNFLSRSALSKKKAIDKAQILRELTAQYQAAISSGLKLNHLDSHHFATIYPNLKEAFIEFANQIGLPCRRVDVIEEGQQNLVVNTPDEFDISFYGEGATLDAFKSRLLEHKAKHPNGVVEFMCHPGLNDDAILETLSSYNVERRDETDILTSNQLKQWLIEQEIEVIGFDSLS